MATARDVVDGALELLGVKAAESAVTAAEAINGLSGLNDMLNEWNLEGLQIGLETIDDLDEELFVDDGAVGPLKANLAIYIAPGYDRTVTPELAQRAKRGKSTLRANVFECPVEYPSTLPVGSGNESIRVTTNGDVAGSTFSNRFYPGNRSKCN